MRYLWTQAETVLRAYRGEAPMTHVLRRHFREHPALGSRDRRLLSAMIYGWFRVRRFVRESPGLREELVAGLALCARSLPQVERLLPESLAQSADPEAALGTLGITLDCSMPFEIDLSEGVAPQQWARSMLRQPDTFFRWLGGALPASLKAYHPAQETIGYSRGDGSTAKCNSVAVPPTTPLDKLLAEETYVIQDRSSQRTGVYFRPTAGEAWWDCCSGAGGKSLLLCAIEPGVRLTVSDRRASVLHNLSERFARYGYAKPERLELDGTSREAIEKKLGARRFDGILCDVPCTGSGTWTRTPEQFHFFDPATLESFVTLQRKIAANAAERLKAGGKMIYITCSVFRAENEGNVDWLLAQDGSLQLESSELINGIEEKADCLFVAVLRKQ